MPRLLPLSCVLFLGLLLIGCATHDYGFPGMKPTGHGKSWWADVQRDIASGDVVLGMTPAMVMAAWGKPFTYREVITGSGPEVVWVYYYGTSRQVPQWCYEQRLQGGGYNYRVLLRPEYRIDKVVTFRDGIVVGLRDGSGT